LSIGGGRVVRREREPGENMYDFEAYMTTIPLCHKSRINPGKLVERKGISAKTRNRLNDGHRSKWTPQTTRWKSILSLFNPAIWRGLLNPLSLLKTHN